MPINNYNSGTVVFESWVIKQKIGEGSFGKVYQIERTEFGETYKAALKVISVPQDEAEFKSAIEEGMGYEGAEKYFYSVVEEIVKEFALMSKLKATANVVSYEDHKVVKKSDTFGFDILIRMELLTPLLSYAYEKPFSRRDIIKLGIDMCKALCLCQKYNIIHRDIKPENIFVSENGDFKLGDFGIARTVEKTQSGLSKKGTYNYMAPEVYKGNKYGFSVDIYSLGIVLYRLLNKNRIPFLPAAPTPISYSDRDRALARRMGGDLVPPPFYNQGRLVEIVSKAISFNAKDRYATPVLMQQELEAILYDEVDSSVIYPDGDELELAKNLYASSAHNKAEKENYADGSKTSNVFANENAQTQSTQSPFGAYNNILSENNGKNETVGVFGNIQSVQETSHSITQTVGVFGNNRQTSVSNKKIKLGKKHKIIIAVFSALAIVAIVMGLYINLQFAKQENFVSLVTEASALYESEPEKAAEMLLEAQSLYPQEIEPYIGYAYALYLSMQYDECINYIENDLALGKEFDIATQNRLSEILGAAYFEKQDYAAAASFFRLSTAGGDISESGMRDYAVSLGRLGDIDAAQEVLSMMIDAGNDEHVTNYVNAEVLYAQKDYVKAETIFLQVLNESQDVDLQTRALRSVVALYRDCVNEEKLGNIQIEDAAQKQIDIIVNNMDKLALTSDSAIWEMLALAYFDAYQMNSDVGQEYLINAANAFENVLSMGIVKDYLFVNLFNIYFQLEDYTSAEDMLQHMQTQFPNDYTPYALRSMMLIYTENNKLESQRDFSSAYNEYLTAQSMITSSDDNTYLLQVEGLIVDLQNNGWL